MELWADIKDYEGIYQVSFFGNIRVLPRVVDHPNGRQFRKGKVLKAVKMKNGYLTITLGKDGKLCPVLIHRIMAETFLPNPDNLEQVNHINGIKSDNRIENLEWCSRSDNMKHACRLGLAKPHLNFIRRAS